MKTYRVFLGLGSNIGERHVFLNRAVDELKKVAGTKIVWASSVYEAEPYGRADQPAFLNAALEIETSLAPRELFDEVKQIETRLGRVSSEHWGPREIDVDLLVYDGLVFEDDAVKVPHPELEKRKFVLYPLKELAPDLVHPVNGMTVEEMVGACTDRGRIVQSTYHIVV